MKMTVISGSSIAAAAIALTMSGVTLAPASAKAAKSVHCFGINACKGQGSCKSAKNACKGQNSCKGQGWLPEKSAKACTKMGGKVG
jgi:hypothetical protein